MFRTISRCLVLLCMLRFAAAQEPPAAAPAARSAASMAAREIKLSTWCRFNAGPSAGSTRNLAPQPAQAVGSACHDQDGNSGIIIEFAYHPPTKAIAPLPTPTPAPPPLPAPVIVTPPPPPPPTAVMEEKNPGATAAKPPVARDPDRTDRESPATETESPPTEHPAATAPEPSYGQRVGDWYKQLKQGSIEYNVPQKMVWKVASTVTVVIHGYQAPKTSALPEATGSGTLKVSDRMKVKLLSPDHPDEFTITNEDSSDDIRYVPADSTTTWRWQVTPNYPAKGQKLVVQAWVLYPDQEDKYAQELPVYTATLDVDASLVTNAARGFWSDPGNWVKYMLPGGAGFLFLAGLIAWAKRKFEKPPPK